MKVFKDIDPWEKHFQSLSLKGIVWQPSDALKLLPFCSFLLVAREGKVNLSVFQLNMEICTFLSSFQ